MTEPNWLNDEENRAWRGHLIMSQMLATQVERDLLSASGLSMADYAVLVQLSEEESHHLRASQLAERMSWSKSRLSHQVARMEARGLLSRRECDEDARGSYVVLSDEGFETIRRAAPAHLESVRQHFLDHMNEDQIRALGDIARVVIDHLVKVGAGPSDVSAMLNPAAATAGD